MSNNLLKKVGAIAVLLFFSFIVFKSSSVIASSTPGTPASLDICTNGIIKAMAVYDSKIYYGGTFTQVGSCSGSAVPVNNLTGKAAASFPKTVGGSVVKIISDGSGGWYMGGSFTAIGGVARAGIAHVLADGSIDSNFNPGQNNNIYAMAIYGDKLYLGGNFTAFGGGATRNYLVAYDLTNATTTSFDLGLNAYVKSLVVYNNTLYVGGNFTTFGGLTRSRLAAYDLVNATTTSLSLGLDGYVNSMIISGNNLYVGGNFTSFGSLTRLRLAAYDLVNATTTSLSLGLDGYVNSMIISGNNLYVGGNFTSFGGLSRGRLAAYDLVNATTTSFNPGLNNYVNTLATSSTTLYVGGFFTTSDNHSYAVAYDLTSNATSTDFYPNVTNIVSAMTYSGSTLYVGGSFTFVDGYSRNYLAAYDTVNATTTNFNLNLNTSANSCPTCGVTALLLSGSTLYVGGDFNSFNGLTRNHLAAHNLASNTTTDFDPNLGASTSVFARTLLLSGNTMYIGGNFTSIGGVTRNRLAAYDILNATTTSLNVSVGSGASDTIYSFLLSGSTLYVGGYFTSFGGLTRNYLAAYDMDNATTTSFNPSLNGFVSAMVATSSNIYFGGSFTRFYGLTRNDFAVYDITNATTTSLNPGASPNYINAMVLDGSTLYSAGSFSTFGGLSRKIAGYDIDSATTTSFNANVRGGNAATYALIKSGSNFYAAGDFNNLDGLTNGFIVSFSSSVTTHTLAYTAGPNGVITGSTSQSVSNGSDGTAVTAVPNSGYSFTSWSDGSTANPRTDTNVTGDISVSASFSTASSAATTPSVSGGTVFLPKSIGSGSVEISAPTLGMVLNIGTITTAGANVLTYLTNRNNFVAPESSYNWLPVCHSFLINNLDLLNRTVTITFLSEPVTLTIKVGEARDIDLDGDNTPDIQATFADIYINRVEITVKSLAKNVSVPANIAPSTFAVSTPTATKFVFARNLSFLMVHNDVKELQKYLNANGFIVAKTGAGSPGKETTKFGLATKQALIKFQQANKIKPAVGYLGPITRKAVNGK